VTVEYSATLKVHHPGRAARWTPFVVAIGGLAVYPGSARAQLTDPHAVQPERPSVATHAGTVAPRYIELESGLELDGLVGDGNSLGIPTTIKMGLARRLQLSVQLPTAAPYREAIGLGDLSVGVKWRLLQHAPVLKDFALLPSLKFPTGSERAGRGTGTTDASLLFISSRTIGPVSLDLNFGYTHHGGDGSVVPKNSTLWAVSTGFTISGPLGAALEVFGYPGTSGPTGAPATLAILTGPTLQLHSWLAIDAGTIIPLSGGQEHALYSGLVWNLGRL